MGFEEVGECVRGRFIPVIVLVAMESWMFLVSESNLSIFVWGSLPGVERAFHRDGHGQRRPHHGERDAKMFERSLER